MRTIFGEPPDFGHMDFNIAKGYELEVCFTRRAIGHLKLDVHVLAISARPVKIAVDDQMFFNFVNVLALINADELVHRIFPDSQSSNMSKLYPLITLSQTI